MKNNKKTFSNLLLLFIFALVFPHGLQAQDAENITHIQYLSGTDKDHRVEWDFKINRGRGSGRWSKIPVPSNWELEGFGVYAYGHQWRSLLPDSDATAQYRHRFTLSRKWRNKTVELVFEGVMTDAQVKINGKVVGPVHQGGFYRFKYDISDYLDFKGENVLEVEVKNTSENESVNKAERDADFWAFSGIYRPVYLEVKPQEYIDRVAIDAKANGAFAMDVYGENLKKTTSVQAQLYDLDGRPFGQQFIKKRDRDKTKYRLEANFNQPKLWSSEFPYRYKVVVQLMRGDVVLHQITEKFGFRTVELRAKDGFYVNGEKVKFKGVNRHSFWPTSGRTTSRKLSEIDVQLMKDMNMNAVRMSHYPPSQHFLEVTDSLGLYVIDELTGWQDEYDTRVGKKLVKELIVRDVNHPSIVMWANGNEGGNNYDLLEEYPKYDIQDRVVIHPWNTLGKTNTLHYPSYDYLYQALTYGDKVYFPTEFLHGLYDGGHGAGLEDYWSIMQSSPLSAGGFLWVFADEGVVRTDLDDFIDVKDKETYAPDGILGPYREKEGSFYAIKDIWSPVYISKKFITTEFNGRLKLENRYHFTNLEQCQFEWQLMEFPNPNDTTTRATTIASGKLKVTDIAPGLSGQLRIDLPESWQRSDALCLRVKDPHGRVINNWSWPIKSSEETATAIVSGVGDNKAIGWEQGDNLVLSASGVQVSLSMDSGLITSVENQLTPISFTNGPRLTDQQSVFKSLEHFQDGEDYVVVMTYEGPIKKMVYTMQGNGWLKLDYSYLIRGHKDYMGISFDYPEDKVNGVKWLGKGPYSVWKNRLKGQTFGVHQKAYNNTVVGSNWDYPAFKGYHDQMYWAVIESEEYPITIVSATDGIFLHLFTPKNSNNENTNPAFPQGDISFMDVISPIGTKFMAPEKLGPQSQKTEFHHRDDHQRLWGATLYFDFGIHAKK